MELLELSKKDPVAIQLKTDIWGLEFLVTFLPSGPSDPFFSLVLRERDIVHFPTFVAASVRGYCQMLSDEDIQQTVDHLSRPASLLRFRQCLWKNWTFIRGFFMRKKYTANGVLVGPLPSTVSDQTLGFKNKGGLFALILKEDTPRDSLRPNITLVSDKQECLDCPFFPQGTTSSLASPSPSPSPSSSSSPTSPSPTSNPSSPSSSSATFSASQKQDRVMANTALIAELVSKFI